MDKREELERKKVETDVARSLLTAFSNKANQLRELYGESDPSKFRLEPNEQKILRKINNSGLLEGLAAGSLTLLALRRLRVMMLRRIQQRLYQQQMGGSGAVTPPSPMQQMLQQRHQQFNNNNNNNPFQNANAAKAYKEGSFSHVFGWLLDGAASITMAVIVTLKMMDLDHILDEASKIPLTAGYSTVSREFCPVAIDWYKQLEAMGASGDEQMKDVLENTQTETLTSLFSFAKNCELRLRYEQILRNEKGVSSPDFRIAIPPPGVPRDLDLISSLTTTTPTSWMGEEQDQQVQSSNFDETENWADGFVKDQEDSGRQR